MLNQSTFTSRVYGLALAFPGKTATELRKKYIALHGDTQAGGTYNIGIVLHKLVGRHALTRTGTPRTYRYYKGNAPVVLRQASGVRQHVIETVAAAEWNTPVTASTDQVVVDVIAAKLKRKLTQIANTQQLPMQF